MPMQSLENKGTYLGKIYFLAVLGFLLAWVSPLG
jgi:hypothetical protein